MLDEMPRKMTPDEEKKTALDWEYSDERKVLMEKQRRLKANLEVYQVGSFSQIDRIRSVIE